MNETKVLNKLLEHDERFASLEASMEVVKENLNHLINSTDKILNTVNRLDQEKTVANYRLDQHDKRITKLEQHSPAV